MKRRAGTYTVLLSKSVSVFLCSVWVVWCLCFFFFFWNNDTLACLKTYLPCSELLQVTWFENCFSRNKSMWTLPQRLFLTQIFPRVTKEEQRILNCCRYTLHGYNTCRITIGTCRISQPSCWCWLVGETIAGHLQHQGAAAELGTGTSWVDGDVKCASG